MFKCYRQLEQADCGIACIRMIARHYGKKITNEFLQDLADKSRLGISAYEIVACCQKIGLESVALSIPKDSLHMMPLPAIMLWDNNHYVVLYKINSKSNTFHIADPANGKIKLKESDFLEKWLNQDCNKGLSILLDETEDFKNTVFPKSDNASEFVRFLLKYFHKEKNAFLFAILITLLIMLVDYSMPILLQKTIDHGIALKNMHIVLSLLIAQLFISLGGIVATVSMRFLLTKTGLKVNFTMISDFLKKLSALPISFFDKNSSSDFVQKINDHSRIKDFLISFPNEISVMIMNLSIFSILLFHYSTIILLIVITGCLLEICWNILFLNIRKTLDTKLFSYRATNGNHAYELANGMKDLKVNNAEENRISKWEKSQVDINSCTLKLTRVSIVHESGHTLLTRLKEFAVMGVSAWMVINGEMTFGIMMSLAYITGRLSQPFSQLSNSIVTLQSAMMSYLRIKNIIKTKPQSKKRIFIQSASLKFDNVWFKYAGSESKYVIKDLSLIINPGETVALVGESGSGKTTLIKLMLGFYMPHDGEITLGGIDVKDIEESDWLENCGVVLQNGKIFAGSILENIALCDDSSVNLERVYDLLKLVGLFEFASSLPMGVHTQLGVSGIELSGGQFQRILIARALYKDANILFLDEATSSLDAISERRIMENIRNFSHNKTLIISAHRLSTVKFADKILYLKNGEISEQGSHDQLIEAKGLYWNLVKNQMMSEANTTG